MRKALRRLHKSFHSCNREFCDKFFISIKENKKIDIENKIMDKLVRKIYK